MRIGIDISQTAYERTGVANYLTNLVCSVLSKKSQNEYVLFFSSFRKNPSQKILEAVSNNPKSSIVKVKFPPTVLAKLWNDAHLIPIEIFIGKVDLFITSDWTEPPAKARKATIIYDMTVFKSPHETDEKIVKTQKRKLSWVKKESDIIFTISKSGKKDVEEILKIDGSKISVIYPGF